MELRSDVEDLLALLRAAAEGIMPPPAALIVFGSTARGSARPDSDLDVLAVRPAGVDFDDNEWGDTLDDWRCAARAITGRLVSFLEVEEADVPELLARPGPTVWTAIVQEGVVVAGLPLDRVAEVSLVG